jgi:hypothetical protein
MMELAALGAFAPEVLWSCLAVLSGATGYAMVVPAIKPVTEDIDPLLPQETLLRKKRKSSRMVPIDEEKLA